MKVLVHDGIGVRLAARRLNVARFVRPRDVTGTLSLNRAQFDALVLGLLPRRRIGEAGVITQLQAVSIAVSVRSKSYWATRTWRRP